MKDYPYLKFPTLYHRVITDQIIFGRFSIHFWRISANSPRRAFTFRITVPRAFPLLPPVFPETFLAPVPVLARLTRITATIPEIKSAVWWTRKKLEKAPVPGL